MQEYQRLTGGQIMLIEALVQPDAEVDFDPPRVKDLYRPADLSWCSSSTQTSPTG
jgi:hypothetical protein